MTANNLSMSCAEVYWCIVDFESIDSNNIARETGLAKSTVQGHLSTLEKNQVIKGQGRPKLYCVSDDVTSETLEWLKDVEQLARATRNFRVTTLPMLPQAR